jgi:2'-5' RNA ligase
MGGVEDETHYGFWLLPDKHSKAQVRDLIRTVQSEHLNKPTFLPHVSVFSSQQISLEEAQVTVQQAAEGIEPFTVEVEDLAYESDDWSRTLYLKLANHPLLTKISNRLSAHFGEKYDLFPHLSIAYDEDMTTAEKERWIDTLETPDEVTLSSLVAVNPHSVENDWREYERWSVDCKHHLQKVRQQQ